MTDGLECAEVSIATAHAMRAMGHPDPLPPYTLRVERCDGHAFTVAVLNTNNLRELIAALNPNESTITLHHGGAGDSLANVVALLTGAVALH